MTLIESVPGGMKSMFKSVVSILVFSFQLHNLDNLACFLFCVLITLELKSQNRKLRPMYF